MMRIIDAECDALAETIGRRAFKTRDDIQEWLDNAPTLYNYVNINDKIKELKSLIPEALCDKVTEKLLANQCWDAWAYCLECVSEMADAWKKINGKNLIWVLGHYEHKPETDSMNYSFDPTSLYSI